MPELARQLGRRGNARELLDRLGADPTGEVRGAAADERDARDPEEAARRQLEPSELGGPVLEHDPAEQAALHRLALLVDLLQHEVRELALVALAPDGLERDLVEGTLHAVLEARDLGRSVRKEECHLAILEEHDAPRVRREHLRIARQEDLAVPETDHERRAVPRGDQRAGLVEERDGDSPRTANVRERGSDRRDRVALRVGAEPVDAPVGQRNQVDEHLRVRLRSELDARLQEPRLERPHVLDDAIVHERDAIRSIEVRMRVRLRHTAVRRPSGVRDPAPPLERVRHLPVELLDAPDLPVVGKCVAVPDDEARGVVAAVLEPTEARDEHVASVARADVADDAAHLCLRRGPVSSPHTDTFARTAPRSRFVGGFWLGQAREAPMEQFSVRWTAKSERPPGLALSIEAENWMVAVGLAIEQLRADAIRVGTIACDLRADGAIEVSDPDAGPLLQFRPLDPPLEEDEDTVLDSLRFDLAPAEASLARGAHRDGRDPVTEPPDPRFLETAGRQDLLALEARADALGPWPLSANDALDLLLEHVPAESASILAHEPHEQLLRFIATRGPRAGKLEGLAIPANAGIAGVVLRSGMTASIREAKDEPYHYGAVDAHTGYHTGALLALPIRQGSTVRGVLELMNPFGAWSFAPSHQRAAQVIADVLSR